MVLRFAARDSPIAVSRATWKAVAKQHGLTEDQALHSAMARVVGKSRFLASVHDLRILNHHLSVPGLLCSGFGGVL